MKAEGESGFMGETYPASARLILDLGPGSVPIEQYVAYFRGATVLLVARSAETLEMIRKEIAEEGGTALTRFLGAFMSGYQLVIAAVKPYFPTATAVKTSREARTGTWSSLSQSNGDTTPHTATFLTMWLDHGIAPMNASAEYVIVPNVTPDAMRSWVFANRISIVANTPTVAAVRRDDALGIVFWSAGSVDGYEADGPAIVYLSESGDSLQLSVADPTNGSGTIRITLPGRYLGQNAVATGRSTIVSIPRNGGRTTTVSLTPEPPARRRSAKS